LLDLIFHGILASQGRFHDTIGGIFLSIATVTPNQVVELLTPIYAKTSPREVPTIMLWGQPGIGKSDAVHLLAEHLQRVTGKTVEVTDVRLLLFNPIDLRGIPVVNSEKEFAVWLKPKIFDFTHDDQHLHILFLDEISAAPPSVQAAAFQLTLDRKIGEHDLPDNVIVIAAGNRMQDKGVTFRMPTPLANRMTHLEVVAQFDDWKKWALKNHIHEWVIGFLSFQTDLFNRFDPVNENTAFPTPRSWSFVSKYLYLYDSLEDAMPMIKGSVGEEAATEFAHYATNHMDLPEVDEIIAGKSVQIDNSKIDIVYAICSALAIRARNFSDTQLENVMHFLLGDTLAREYVIMTMKDMLRNGIVKQRVKALPRFGEFLSNYGKTLLV
jgi:hypothetical protein